MSFDPKRHVIKVQGNREYLPVSARLVWFRSEHPDWGIVTTVVEINLTPENGRRPYAIFQAQIFNAEGRLMATATKMEDERGFPDFIEKAETGSVGRALAMCGYGTQFAPELEESGNRGDNYGGGGNRYQGNYAARPNAPGNGSARPMQIAPPPQQNRPAPAPAAVPPPVSPPVEDEEPYEAPTPRDAAPAPAPAAANGNAPAPRTPPQGRVAPTGSTIQRVREPEPDDMPMPDDEDDDVDPFADEEEPAPRTAAPRPTAARPTSAPAEAASNQCSAEGCNALLTPAQLTMSINKFGKPLCLAHQKEVVPAGAGAAPSGRRNARSSGGDTLL